MKRLELKVPPLLAWLLLAAAMAGVARFAPSGGIYRVSRNPMYLGILLALAGWAVHLSNAGAALFLPAFVAYITRYQIEPEERALLAKFGPEYGKYMARVPRWL